MLGQENNPRMRCRPTQSRSFINQHHVFINHYAMQRIATADFLTNPIEELRAVVVQRLGRTGWKVVSSNPSPAKPDYKRNTSCVT